MIEDDTQNSRHAASAAFHNAPRLTKIAQAGMQGGPLMHPSVRFFRQVQGLVLAQFRTGIQRNIRPIAPT